MDLPLFPLHHVLFPGRPLPLHLFEPRYLHLLRDCLQAERRFGVVAIRSGREVGVDWRAGDDPDEGGACIHAVGTMTEIQTVAERPDGRFDIITRGCCRFRIVRALHDRPYLHAEVDLLVDEVDDADHRAAAHLREVLVPYLKGLGVPDEYCERLPDDPGQLSYLAASTLQVEVPAQQLLLELPTHAERLLETARIIRRESGISRRLGVVGSFRPAGPGGAQLN